MKTNASTRVKSIKAQASQGITAPIGFPDEFPVAADLVVAAGCDGSSVHPKASDLGAHPTVREIKLKVRRAHVRNERFPDSEANKMAGLTVSRMDFGNFMKSVRSKAPRTALSAAAAHLEVTRFVLMRMEEGSPTKLTRPQIKDLLEYYQASHEDAAKALGLLEEVRAQDSAAKAQGNSKGFWKPYSDQVAPNFEKLLRLEGVADQIITYQPVIVPGLLQTPDYRREIVRVTLPRLSAVDVERRVELTQKRQKRLDDTGFRLEAFISEAVLWNRPGLPEVMSAQLRWLAEVGDRDNIEIRALPFAIGPHPGLVIQQFILLHLPKGASGMTLPPVVYAEGAIGSVLHEHDEEINEYREAIAGLRAVALTAQDTRDFLVRIAKEHAA
ncbi:DUF5753 domain-containing protein [Nocardia niigatensis]|uniref:DUF5753 domain-containing protein n=1 Tax=Nocardia niigatensis TaxID=209249 RepID=UPI0012F68600|nr:DUF5753 domain-containing protein [Nocardia niigatensis]